MIRRRVPEPAIPQALEASAAVEPLLERIEPTASRPASEVARCVADEHPVLVGRVRCAFDDGSEAWVPCLQGVRPRCGDRVLVLGAHGAPGGVVAGVVDGFRRRLEPDPRDSQVRRLRADEVIRIESDEGVPLIEVRATDAGPAVRVLSKDLTMESSGALRLAGESVEIVARQGGVEVRATDDVKLNGEQIHLN